MAYTTTASSGLDHAAYNLAVDQALRATLHFVPIADVRPTAQAHPGTSVIFTLIDDLAIASTALDESTDVTPVAVTDSTATVTLVEYGNAVITTAKLRGTSMVAFDPIVADQIARNAAISMDELAVIQLRGGSQVAFVTAARNARNKVIPTDILNADAVRAAVAHLRAANVADFNGTYAGFVHPDVAYDLMGDSSNHAAWIYPASYVDTTRIWNGEVGRFNGVSFVQASRTPLVADAGSSTTLTDVYLSLILGRQALAKAFSYTAGWGESPIIVAGPVTDILERFQPMGWKWLGGFARYREAALWRIETASTIGANS